MRCPSTSRWQRSKPAREIRAEHVAVGKAPVVVRCVAVVAFLGLSLASDSAVAEVPSDQVGQSVELPAQPGNHWVWVNDLVLKWSALFDGDSGDMLGMLDSGGFMAPKAPQWAKNRDEIYTVDRTYSRMHHGEMKDFVFIYDARKLEVIGEIELPPKVADTATGIALVGMLDGDRFLAVLNQSPGSSVSIVDLESRAFVGEIQTAGCAGVYPAGPLRFGMLCGNGTAITVVLTETGELAEIQRSAPFFDVVTDPPNVWDEHHTRRQCVDCRDARVDFQRNDLWQPDPDERQLSRGRWDRNGERHTRCL